MNCPVCDDRMRPVMRNGVEIDVCPGCKGVWLDRGELEKLIAMENSGNYDQRPADNANFAPRRDHDDHDDHDRRDKRDSHDSHDSHDNRYDSRSGSGSQQKRKGSWLGDILGGIGGGDD